MDLEKIRFFGARQGYMFICKNSMGVTPLELDGVISRYAIWNYDSNRPYEFCAEDINDCQLICKPISKMSEEDKKEHFAKFLHENHYDDNQEKYSLSEHYNWLITHHYVTDEEFVKYNCVEMEEY